MAHFFSSNEEVHLSRLESSVVFPSCKMNALLAGHIIKDDSTNRV
jgi:hypothetical protein